VDSRIAFSEATKLAVEANIGMADVKLQSSGRSHKPRNLAKSVTVE